MTLYLEPSEWKKFRIECMKRDLTPSALIRDFIAHTLQKWEQEEKKKK